MRRADNLTTFMCRLSWYLGASNSWNPQGLSRSVMGLLYLLLSISNLQSTRKNLKITSGTHEACTCVYNTISVGIWKHKTHKMFQGHIHKPLYQSAIFIYRRSLAELRVTWAVAKPPFQPRDLISIHRNQSRNVYSTLFLYESYLTFRSLTTYIYVVQQR